MRKSVNFGKVVFVAGLGGVVMLGAAALAPQTQGAFRPCPQIQCLDVWNPVICPNGQIYSNACYARRACQTGCVAY